MRAVWKFKPLFNDGELLIGRDGISGSVCFVFDDNEFEFSDGQIVAMIDILQGIVDSGEE